MAELKKSLGYGTIIALSITSLLGTGLFIGPAIAAKYAGVSSIIAWVILAAISVYVAACFGELASMFPSAGGVYEYAKRAYGRFPSFMIGWVTWLVANISVCLMIVAAMNYLNPLIVNFFSYILDETVRGAVVHAVESEIFKIVVGCIIILFFNSIAFRGIEASSVIIIFFAITTLIVISMVVVPGVSLVQMSNFEGVWAVNPILIFVSVFFILETFFGWEYVTFLAEETKNPEKVIPISLVLTTLLVTILGVLVAFIMLGAMPVNELANSSAPFFDMGVKIYGQIGGIVIIIGVVISLLGSSAGCVFSTPRLLLALARDKLFINQLSDVHETYRTPYKAIAFQTIVMMVILVIGFAAYQTLLSFLVPMALIMYISVLLTLPILRLKNKEQKRHFRVPFGKIGPVIVAILYASVVFVWLIKTPGSVSLFKMIVSLTLFGVPIYLLLLFHYDPDVVVRLNDLFAYFSLVFERMLVPSRIKRDIFNHLDKLENSKVLEFGCGVGTITTELARRVGPSGAVIATDVSYTQVKIAKKRVSKLGYSNVHFIHDIHQVNRVHHEIPKVDCIVSVGMLGYIQDIKKVLKEMNQLLPEGGKVFFVDYIDVFKVIPNVSWLSHHEELKTLFRECGFSVRVEKVKGSLWNYVFIYGIKSSDDVPFI
ncbi:MAG: amino acid permease [Candidatus Woesearchaeota archaeon]